jgi:DNA invertase Pin-like site-specific DNA recombinase
MLTILGGLAEFERTLIQARTARRACAAQRGRHERLMPCDVLIVTRLDRLARA